MSKGIWKTSSAGREIEKMVQRPMVRVTVFFVAIVCMIFGCLRGELPVVFGKAITACLECIGLG